MYHYQIKLWIGVDWNEEEEEDFLFGECEDDDDPYLNCEEAW